MYITTLISTQISFLHGLRGICQWEPNLIFMGSYNSFEIFETSNTISMYENLETCIHRSHTTELSTAPTSHIYGALLSRRQPSTTIQLLLLIIIQFCHLAAMDPAPKMCEHKIRKSEYINKLGQSKETGAHRNI